MLLAALDKVPNPFVIEDDPMVRGGDFHCELLVGVVPIFTCLLGVVGEEEDKQPPGAIPSCGPFSRGRHSPRRR